MSYTTTDVPWYDADEVLPSKEEYGPYPRVIVALYYVDHPDWGCGQQVAELRYLGKNKNRPVWLSADKNLTPIENEARCVRFWTPMLTPPILINEKGTQNV